jgi:hypothetical protein
MEITPEQILSDMPIALETALKVRQFKALGICRSTKDQLPKFFCDVDGNNIAIENFHRDFANQKWIPILIAEGITLDEFEKLVDGNPNYGKSFLYDWDFDAKKYFIVDGPSYEHGYYTRKIVNCLLRILQTKYHEDFEIFEDVGDVAIRMESFSEEIRIPDACVFISNRFAINAVQFRKPFLVVETAISQSSQSLMAKMQNWRNYGIPYVIGVDRRISNQEVDFIFFSKNNPDSIQTFKIGEYAIPIFKFSKSLISESYDIGSFDLEPNIDEFEVEVEIVCI